MLDLSSLSPELINSYTNALVKMVVTIAIIVCLILYRGTIADVFRTLTKLTLKAMGFEAIAEFNGSLPQEESKEEPSESKEEQVNPEELKSEEVSLVEEEETPTTF